MSPGAAAHGIALAQAAHGSGRQVAEVQTLGEVQRLLGPIDRLLRVLGPLRRPSLRQQGLDQVPIRELGNQLGHRLLGLLVVLERGQRQRALQADPRPLVRLRELDGPPEQVHGLLFGPGLLGPPRGEQKAVDRFAHVAGLAPMVGEDRRDRAGESGERLLEVASHRCMPVTPPSARERPVRGVAHQRVLEPIFDVALELARRLATDEVP